MITYKIMILIEKAKFKAKFKAIFNDVKDLVSLIMNIFLILN